MGILINTLYKAFPGLPELERKTEGFIREAKHAYDLGNRIADYIIEEKDYITARLEQTLNYYMNSLKTSIYKLFESLEKGFKKNNKDIVMSRVNRAGQEEKQGKEQEEELTRTPKHPARTTPKKQGLERIIRTRDNRYTRYTKYTGCSETYYPGTYLDSLLEKIDEKYEKYINDSVRITELYNNGYNTRQIIREAARKGYKGINNYKDVTDRVVVGIIQGASYTRNYNNMIATKLGARAQLIMDYLAGKSYKEIKENLKRNTNGMSISNSTILRIMHDYEKRTGRKVVGKRKGKGKRKTRNNKKKTISHPQ